VPPAVHPQLTAHYQPLPPWQQHEQHQHSQTQLQWQPQLPSAVRPSPLAPADPATVLARGADGLLPIHQPWPPPQMQALPAAAGVQLAGAGAGAIPSSSRRTRLVGLIGRLQDLLQQMDSNEAPHAAAGAAADVAAAPAGTHWAPLGPRGSVAPAAAARAFTAAAAAHAAPTAAGTAALTAPAVASGISGMTGGSRSVPGSTAPGGICRPAAGGVCGRVVGCSLGSEAAGGGSCVDAAAGSCERVVGCSFGGQPAGGGGRCNLCEGVGSASTIFTAALAEQLPGSCPPRGEAAEVSARVKQEHEPLPPVVMIGPSMPAGSGGTVADPCMPVGVYMV
jgi:hypothetical protein